MTGHPGLTVQRLTGWASVRPRLRWTAADCRPAFIIIDREAWSPSRASAAQRDRILTWLPVSGRPIVADVGRFVLWGPQPVVVVP